MSDWPHYVAVAKDKGSHILVEPGDRGRLILPTHDYGLATPYLGGVEYRAILCDRMGIDAHTLVVEYEIFFEGSEVVADLTVVEVVDRDCSLSFQYLWADWNDACDKFEKSCRISAVPSFLRAFLARGGAGAAKKKLRPWCAFGYYQTIFPLIERLVQEAGFKQIDRPEQLTIGLRSVVFIVKTDAGRLFLKRSQKESGEAFLNLRLHELFPDRTQKVVNVSLDMQATLTLDFGHDLLRLCFNPKAHKRAMGYEDPHAVADSVLQQWASFQRESTSQVKNLREAGLPVHDAGWFRSGFDDVLLYVKEKECLSLKQQKRLGACRALLEKGCDILESSVVPKTLVHGDLGVQNIAQPNGPGTKYVFFDWEYAYIGHPFFDLEDCDENLKAAESAYYESWRGYADPKTLEMLVAWSKPIGLLRLAIVDVRGSQSCDQADVREKRAAIVEYIDEMLNCLDTIDGGGIVFSSSNHGVSG